MSSPNDRAPDASSSPRATQITVGYKALSPKLEDRLKKITVNPEAGDAPETSMGRGPRTGKAFHAQGWLAVRPRRRGGQDEGEPAENRGTRHGAQRDEGEGEGKGEEDG